MAFSSLSSQQRVMVLLELLGGPKFAAEMRAAAASSGLLGKNIERTGKQMQVAGRRTFITTQALYTLRRYAFYGTIALTAMGGAVVKLGYSYLSAMQTARVALSPVIKDQGKLNSYLNQLFQISKYSPFVITDLAVAFRQLFAGLSGTGVTAPTILRTIQSLTDLMSFTGKTGPGALTRVSLALQHMAFAGRLTGYAVNQLSRDGIPIMRILNEQFGITGDQLHNISKMGIPAAKVLEAINKFARTNPAVRGAAMRISLRTFSGLIQVVRDSLSQLSGAFIGGAYKGGQSWLFNIAKPGGPLDRLSNVGNTKGGTAALLYLSKQISGSSGLGRGLLLLLSIIKNIGRVFIHVLIPAWVIAAHTLIIFYPSLKLINFALGFMADHAKILRWVFAALAAEFIITHFALGGAWVMMRFWNIATLGSIMPLTRLIKFLRILRTVELTKGIAGLSKWAFALKAGGKAETVWGKNAYVNTGLLARFTRRVITAIKRLKELRVAMIGAGFASAIGAGMATSGVGLLAFAAYKDFTTKNLQKIGQTSVGTSVVRGGGVNYVQTPGGMRLTRLAPGSSILPTTRTTTDPSTTGAAGEPLVVHSHVHLDGKQIAESVAKTKAAKAARR